MTDEWTEKDISKIYDNFNILTSLIQRCGTPFTYKDVPYPSLPIMILGCNSTITEFFSANLISYFIYNFKPSQYRSITKDSLTEYLYNYIKYINTTCVKENSNFDILNHIQNDTEYIVYNSIIDYILPSLIYIIHTSITVSNDLQKINKCGFIFNIRKIETPDLPYNIEQINSYRSKIRDNGIRNFIGVL